MLCLPENLICGYFDCSEFGNLKISPKRKVTKFEIELYLEDGLTTITENNIYEIKKNHIHIAKPGQIRYSYLPFSTAYLKFSATGEIADRLTETTEYFESRHPIIVRNKMDEIIMLNDDSNYLLLYSKLLSLLNLILSDAKAPNFRSGINYEVISIAKRFTEKYFAEPIKLKDIAGSVNLSSIYFHNIFTETTGITPHQYLINCRIENAKKLLWNPKISISEIAEKSGFGCQQYFNKVFKKETGTTPAEYRKSFQQNYLL